MPSTHHFSAGTLHILALLSLLSATTGHTHRAIALPPLRREARLDRRATLTYSGCYSSSDGLTDQGSATFQTSSNCQPICLGKNQAVLGLSDGSDCWCGATLPPASSKVDDSNCNTPCQGFGSDDCGGGTNFWSVYLTGLTETVANADDGSSSSSSAPAVTTTAVVVAAAPLPPSTTSASSSSVTQAPTVVTSVAPSTTVIVTAPAAHAESTSTPTASSSAGGHSNKAGVTAGVVIGVVLAVAGIVALVFWIKQKRRKDANEAYQRSNQVSEFMQGGREPKPPPSAYSNMSDQRLDPEAGARRNSVGSIADNQDYSRKILRVANPDRQ